MFDGKLKRESLRRIYLANKTEKFTLTMSPELRKWLEAWADYLNLSLNGLLFVILTEKIEEKLMEWQQDEEACKYFTLEVLER